jgi:hypothetical protein
LGGLGLEKKKIFLSHGVANPLSIPKNFPVFIIFLLPEAKNEHLLKPRKTPFYLSMKFGVFGLKKKKIILSCSLGQRDIRSKNRFEKSVAIPEKTQSENFKTRRRLSKTYNIPISLRVGM